MNFGGNTAYKKEESKRKNHAHVRKFFNNIFNNILAINEDITISESAS